MVAGGPAIAARHSQPSHRYTRLLTFLEDTKLSKLSCVASVHVHCRRRSRRVESSRDALTPKSRVMAEVGPPSRLAKSSTTTMFSMDGLSACELHYVAACLRAKSFLLRSECYLNGCHDCGTCDTTLLFRLHIFHEQPLSLAYPSLYTLCTAILCFKTVL